jgi:hypothetical protein
MTITTVGYDLSPKTFLGKLIGNVNVIFKFFAINSWYACEKNERLYDLLILYCKEMRVKHKMGIGQCIYAQYVFCCFANFCQSDNCKNMIPLCAL